MFDRTALSRRALLSSSLLAASAPAFGAEVVSYRDAGAPIPARVSDLLARMTLEEKAAQLTSMWNRKGEICDKEGRFSPDKAQTAIPYGVGQIARPSDFRGLREMRYPPYRTLTDTADFVNAVQRYHVEHTRLGIPALFHDELAHGLLANDATIFPSPPALASTWDPDLVERVFTVAAREARLRGTTVALAPVVDLARDPRFGRVEEFFGEDPYLVSTIGLAGVRGLQGRKRPIGKDRVFSTLKHFVHATPAGGLNISPADISERNFRENYLVPFMRIVREGDPAIVMPSYNEFQGVPSHANVDLLQKVGRRMLGFNGAYFSDYDGIGNLESQHHVVGNKDDAAVLAMNAGVQADLPEGVSYAGLPQLVRSGRVSEAQVDAAVAQVLHLKFEAGLFENPYIDRKALIGGTNRPAEVALARLAAARSVILLKNKDRLAPLAPKPGMRVAVIGPNANEPLFGGYSGDNAKAVGILEGIRRNAPPGVTIEHADGVWITAPDEHGRHLSYSPIADIPEADDDKRIDEAVALVGRADVVVLVLGDVPAVTREAVAWDYPGDRSTLGLWGRQDKLVEAIAKTGKPIITLLLAGRALAVPRLAEVSDTLFMGWYLGQEGGNAFADILFGKSTPGGKLTVSMPRSVGDLPVYYNRHRSNDTNRYLEGKREALFPFGHGLSYSTFEMSAPQLASERIARGQAFELKVEITNTGNRAADEVVQIYIRDEISSVPRPGLELKAFRRISLAPGERTSVAFAMTPDDLAFWDIAMQWSVEPGDFLIYAGSSSTELKSAKLTVV